MQKIRNVIFDIGNVLVRFEPMAYLLDWFDDGDLASSLHKIIFAGPEWIMLDRGVMTQDEAEAKLRKQFPEFAQEISLVFSDWFSILKPIGSSVDVLCRLKDAGYNIYALSNFHHAAFQHIFQRHDWFQLFDGMIISYEHKLIKPEPAIYQLLLSKYALLPERSLFIDDSLDNLVAASDFGIRGIHYQSAEQFKLELDYILK